MALASSNPQGGSKLGAAGSSSSPIVTSLGHFYVIKIPHHKKTGNKLLDQEAEARIQLLVGTIQELIKDHSHVMPVHSLIQQRNQEASSQAVADTDLMFHSVTTLRSLPDEWLITHIVQHSDMSVDDVVSAQVQDADAISNFIVYECQLPALLVLGPELHVKVVMQRLLNARSAMFGNRLFKFKAEGGLLSSGLVNWKEACYVVEFNSANNMLSAVTHRFSSTKVVVTDAYIDSTWKLDGNWGDHIACFRKGNFPPVKLNTFFQKSQGPNAHPAVTARSRDFQKQVQEIYSRWQEEMSQAKGSGADSTLEAKSKLEKSTQDKKRESMSGMRQKAFEAAAKKRARRGVSFVEERAQEN